MWRCEGEKETEAEGASILTEVVGNAKEDNIGWVESAIVWLRPVDTADNSGDEGRRLGRINAVEGGRATKRSNFCFDSGAVKTILRPSDVDKRKIKTTPDT